MATRVVSPLATSANQLRQKPVQRAKCSNSQDYKRTLNQKGFEKKRRGVLSAHVRQKSLKRTPLRRQSKKRAAESKVYREKRKAFLAAHPVCEFSGCFDRSLDVHHMQGRGLNYLNEKTWMAVDRKHHNWIHRHPNEAREMGLLR